MFEEDSISILLNFKEMEHVPNIFMSFQKYLFLEMISILIKSGLFFISGSLGANASLGSLGCST